LLILQSQEPDAEVGFHRNIMNTAKIQLYAAQWTPVGIYYWKSDYILTTVRQDYTQWVFIERWFRGAYPSLGHTKIFACKTDQNGKVIQEVPIREWDSYLTLEKYGFYGEGEKVWELPASV
jgi:hypothetical protein